MSKQDSSFELFVDNEPVLIWPELSIDPVITVNPVITIDKATSNDAPSVPEGTQDVWQYLVEHINEFAVAKSIVDFVDANPKALLDRNTPVDLMGLHVLAKVSLKRAAVEHMKAQEAATQAAAALDKARLQTRVSTWRRVFGPISDAVGAFRANPHLLMTAVLATLAMSQLIQVWMH